MRTRIHWLFVLTFTPCVVCQWPTVLGLKKTKYGTFHHKHQTLLLAPSAYANKITDSFRSLLQLRCGEVTSNGYMYVSSPVDDVQAFPTPFIALATSFWKQGMCNVHQNYLQLFLEITKTSTLLLFPAVLLFLGGMLMPELSAKGLNSLLPYLQRIHEWFILSIYPTFWLPAPLSSSVMIFLLRPIMDAILFRWLVKSLWERFFNIANPNNPRDDEDTLRWRFLSSALYGLVHLVNDVSVPGTEIIETRVLEALKTGEVVFLGMTLQRRNWDSGMVKYLLNSQPFLQALGHGVVNGVLSWGLLCPLHQTFGFMSSLGAQYAWHTLWLVNVDTHILIRLFGRIFLPWSPSADKTDS